MSLLVEGRRNVFHHPTVRGGKGDISVSIDALGMSDVLKHLFAWAHFYLEKTILKEACGLVTRDGSCKGEMSLLSISFVQEPSAELVSCVFHNPTGSIHIIPYWDDTS